MLTYSNSSLLLCHDDGIWPTVSVIAALPIESVLHPVLMITGLLLNTMALVVFSLCSYRQTATTLLLSTLLVINVIVLFVSSLSTWLLKVGYIDVPLSSTICILFIYLPRTTRASQSATLSLLVLNRYFVILVRACKSHKDAVWQRRQAFSALLISFVLCSFIYLPVLLGLAQMIFPMFNSAIRWIDIVVLTFFPATLQLIHLLTMLFVMCFCQPQHKSAMHLWADQLVIITSLMFMMSQLPISFVKLLEFVQVASVCYLHRALNLLTFAHLVLTPFLYLLCSRFRRDFLAIVSHCCNSTAARNMMLQPRDSVVVSHARF